VSALADVERHAPVLETEGSGDGDGEPTGRGRPGELVEFVLAHGHLFQLRHVVRFAVLAEAGQFLRRGSGSV
jgi:hypothetical protein